MKDDDEFIVEPGRAEARLHTEAMNPHGPLTGWETVVFELADEDEIAE